MYFGICMVADLMICSWPQPYIWQCGYNPIPVSYMYI